jgi:threonine synthase
MTVAVSKAVEEGAEAVICASTGNTAASAAAYAARAGIRALVLVPGGAVAGGKLAQSRMLGAQVLEVRGSFDEALVAVRSLVERGSHVLVNSLNPNRVAGQKTAVYEIVEELGSPPDA